MAITAKVRNKQIDTGKVLHALVQGEHASGNITFQIIGEEELVEDFASTYFYLLYTRPSDTRPNVLLLTNKQLQDDVISVTFKPTSYFTAQDGTVQIQIMATDTEGLSIDSETGTISGSVIWQTFPGAMFVHASQLTGTETIIEENVLTQYLAGMQELYTQTDQEAAEAQQAASDAGDSAEAAAGSATAAGGSASAAQTSAQQATAAKQAAEAAKNKAQEWAEKETAVETGQYSAKYWAGQAHAEFDALDTYVDETLKPALDDYEETKEGELDDHTDDKKDDLDTYEGAKETELNTYTGTKKTELDTYTGAKKTELDSYVANTNKPALDSYTNNTLKPALLSYEQTQEGTLNTYTGTKKTELDSYVTNTSKPSIDDYIDDEKKPEIDAYIAEQAGQFGADVTTLKGNVSALDKRVSNLEESLDVITEIEYPHATYGTGEVPPNKSKYAEVSVLKGVGRIANQLVTNPSFATETDWIFSGCNYSVSNNILTITATAYRGMAESFVDMQNGHTYLLSAKVKLTTGNTSVRFGAFRSDGNAWADYVFTQNTTNWQTISILFTLTRNDGNCFVILRDERETGWDAIQIADILLKDVTLYFNGSIPTNAQTIAGIQANYPELLIPSDYGTSEVFSTYSAVESRRNNLLDIETWANDRGCSFTKDGNEYTLGPQSSQMFSDLLLLSATDAQMTISGSISAGTAVNPRIDLIASDGTTVTSIFYNTSMPVTATFKAIRLNWSTIGTIKLSSFKIELGTSATPYSPYGTFDTLSLPSPVTLKGAGSVADTDELNVEIEQEVNGQKVKVQKRRQTQRIGQVDLGLLTSATYDSSYSRFRILLPSSLGFAVPSSARTEAVIIPLYVCLANSEVFDASWNLVCYIVPEGSEVSLYIHDNRYSAADIVNGKATWLNGVTMNYPLATPVVTLLDPIPNPFIQVEGGGTIKPVQTNEPEIDSAMTVTYVNKITA